MPPSTGAKMEIIAVHLPKAWLSKIDELCKEGFFSNRSEFIRLALYLYVVGGVYRSVKPPVIKGLKQVVISFHIPKRMLEMVEDTAKELNATRSAVIRAAVFTLLTMKFKLTEVQPKDDDDVELLVGRPRFKTPPSDAAADSEVERCEPPPGAVPFTKEVAELAEKKPVCVSTVMVRCGTGYAVYAVVDNRCHDS